MKQPIIYWFRQDLRLHDNPGLRAAVKTGHPILAVYVLDDETPGQWCHGGAARWWLHHSLAALQQTLKDRGGRLILRRGAAQAELLRLVDEVDACGVYFSRQYEPFAAQVEQGLHAELSARGIEVKRFGGYLLFEPEQLRTQAGEPFKVFTPYWKACLQQPAPGPARQVPRHIEFCRRRLSAGRLRDWDLLPTAPDWAGGLRESWTPGEAGAQQRLRDFLHEGLIGYKVGRDQPARASTSRLSPHLHFGEISARQIWHTLQREAVTTPGAQDDAGHFLREMGWREFSYHLLHHWPSLPSQPFRRQFDAFPWRSDRPALAAWQRGKTGYPLVDAGMRELWHTGWMHNRVRMIVASLLVKNMLVPWQEGEAWFWDTLVDADLANNAASWQWVAGSGADAAPYFRIFNPVTQSQKFDAEGQYIRRWVPELVQLPDKYIHAPWEAPAEVLAAAGVNLGGNYPAPVLDLKATRQQALDAYAAIRSQ
ncbi:deoxyribodipyrimidine photo-lyase [Exilibacterium tricleocarpae]|uniref:Deoxyribodipyrimidine photo-lyase n=1 Tax=Exilibacterium tricleocarpae TaxID=2591008 RepID=A0A545T5Y0_9GAMM|nr:deoxyribodipyrimidine photo-lyase [Exilibacterium tricleocarpae]TQV72624.1 deoxyribodipyrimidine photo-lyase [Exilibacterium tricleocarpae]